MNPKIKNLVAAIAIISLCITISSGCKKKKDATNNPAPGTVVDIDNNVYHTVTVCNKVWMVENLKTTRFNDGQAIPNVPDSMIWRNLTTPGYSWYLNDGNTYKNPYGALYNWWAVNTGKLAPAGWHVPTLYEWQDLINCLGGEIAAGGKMKQQGTAHWLSPNTAATNDSGFTALPGGIRLHDGPFAGLGTVAYWWTATGNVTNDAWYVRIDNLTGEAHMNIVYQQPGFSVRCVKN